jgi:hypothetical protein
LNFGGGADVDEGAENLKAAYLAELLLLVDTDSEAVAFVEGGGGAGTGAGVAHDMQSERIIRRLVDK